MHGRAAAVLFAIAVAALIPSTALAGNANPQVLPPNAKVMGVPLGDWFSRWLSWIVTVPEGSCNANQGGKVFFIPHTAPGTTVETSCTVQAGTMIFASGGGVVCGEVDSVTPAGRRACVVAARSDFEAVAITVDGRQVRDIDRYFAISADFRWFFPDGTSTLAAAAGWHVILAPLSPGEHTIVVRDVVLGEVAQLTAHVTVVSGR